MQVDLIGTNSQSVGVRWIDGNGVVRHAVIDLSAGYAHGLLCISSANESLGFIGESGTMNDKVAQCYAQNNEDWRIEYSSGYLGYRNNKTGEWLSFRDFEKRKQNE